MKEKIIKILQEFREEVGNYDFWDNISDEICEKYNERTKAEW
jgi:hypothetical protein